jgi:hypothetical protein
MGFPIRAWSVIWMLFLIASNARAAEPSPCTRLRMLYPEPGSLSKSIGKTLITGASVSDDYGEVKSPGRRVLENHQSDFVKKAFPHTPSDTILDLLKSELGSKRFRTLIAIDLFFWDPEKGAKGACDPGHVEKILGRLKRFSRSIILAKIPRELARGPSDCVTLINRELESSCEKTPGCFLSPPAPFDRYTGSEPPLQADGLHLSDAGSEFASQSVCVALLELVRNRKREPL